MEPIAYVFSGEKYGLGAGATGRLSTAVDNLLDSGTWLPTKKSRKRFGEENSKQGGRRVVEDEEEGAGEMPGTQGGTATGEASNSKEKDQDTGMIGRGTLLNMGIWEWRCFHGSRFAVAPPTDHHHSMLNHFTYGFQQLLDDTGSIDRIVRHHEFVDAEDCQKHKETVEQLPPLSRTLMLRRTMYPTLINHWNVLTERNHIDFNGFNWTGGLDYRRCVGLILVVVLISPSFDQ
ncbi:hypothetical protein HDV00_010353 [Rhizophlyctis rosea]|nr:hypothetical protein HDV00_010353 [Rhizophlyctis rosea]